MLRRGTIEHRREMGSVLNRAVRKALTERITFEQRLGEHERARHADMLRKIMPDIRNHIPRESQP